MCLKILVSQNCRALELAVSNQGAVTAPWSNWKRNTVQCSSNHDEPRCLNIGNKNTPSAALQLRRR